MARGRVVGVEVRVQKPLNLDKVRAKLAEDIAKVMEDGYARQVGEIAVEMAERPIRYWKRSRKPKFSAKVTSQINPNGKCNVQITLIASGSDSCLENYRRIDRGVRAHKITPKRAKVLLIRAYEPKTRPATVFGLSLSEEFGASLTRFRRTTLYLTEPGMQRWKEYAGSPAQMVRGYKGKYYTNKRWLRTRGEMGKHYRFAKVVKSAHINPRYFLAYIQEATIKASRRLLRQLIGSFRRYARMRDNVRFDVFMTR